MQQKLDRTLGLYSAITISVGTMIGSAIFVLAGTSYEVAGPSASFAVFLSGIAAFFTAFSFCELVTFIPTAGGGYAYVREADDNGILGFICGWGFWLGYAMSCGLFALGFGTFLNYFVPVIPRMIGAYGLIIYVMATNIKGVENSGRLQNIITTGLIGILFLYIFYGIFHLDLSYQTPHFPEGLSGTFTAVGFLYITYIGYGLVTTASEEVINPEKNIPKAIIISLILVTFIKTAVFFIGASIIPWENLLPHVTSTPLTNTAVEMAGAYGGVLFAFAGLLANLSSINTAMLAASRTSFAMSRDYNLPSIFKKINPKTKTPIFSILAATLIVFISTSIQDLEHISTITSIFALVGYSLVNIAVVVFRKKRPDVKRAFKVPFYPYTPILGVVVNVLLVIQLMISDLFAMLIASLIMFAGIGYYFLLKPKLEQAPKGVTPNPIPVLKANQFHNHDNYNVLVAIGENKNAKNLLKLGSMIARYHQGKIIPLHVIDVPEVIPIDSRNEQFARKTNYYQDLIDNYFQDKNLKSLMSDSLSIISRNTSHAILETARNIKPDLILMGWHRSGLAYRMLGGPVHNTLQKTSIPVAIFKKGSNNKIKNILYPYGGGYHSRYTLNVIKNLTDSYNADLTILHIAGQNANQEECQEIAEILRKGIEQVKLAANIKIKKSNSLTEGIIKASEKHDLVVLGTSSDWGVKNYLTGSTTDKIMEKIDCSGLIVRGEKLIIEKKYLRNFSAKLKKLLTD